jgi:hypothetical protein
VNLSAVALTPGGPAQAAAATWHVDTPVERGFQTVLYFRINIQGAPDGVRVDVAGCQFGAVFQSLDYNALNAAPIPSAALSSSKDGKAVIVKLDGARQVTGVATNPVRAMELHRADGRVQADKAAESAGFTDVNFAIQPTDASPLTVNQVTAVNVRSQPGNPRLGIAATDLQAPAIFWPTPDSAGELQVSAGAAFAKALQAFLSARWEQALIDDHLDVAIVAQSDAPCRLTISQFQVAVHWLLSSFPSGAEKQILRYGGKRVERQSVSVELPAAAVVAWATVRVNESFQGRGPAVAQAGTDLLAAGGQISGGRGVRISAGGVQRGAQRLTPPAAMPVAGIALGLMALSPGAQLSAEIQTDRNGLPSGQAVTAADLKLERPGQRQWTVAKLREPVNLSGAPYWIMITAVKGSVIWLAENGGDAVRVFDNLEGRLSETARLDGQAALVRVLPPSPSPALAAGQDQPGATPPAQARLSIGAGSSAGTLQADGSRLFTVTSQVNALLASARAQSPQATVTAIPLVFTAGAGGLITVYPPEIAYDV